MPYRNLEVGSSDARYLFDEFLKSVESRLDDASADRAVVCRDLLVEIYHGPRTFDELIADRSLPLATRAAVSSLDPRNVSLEPEHYSDIDPAQFERVKPLIWLWIMFDRSPLGRNMHLGIPFRRLLARRIFRSCGRDVKIFHDVEVSYGYNIDAGEACTIHRGVLLDDRGGLRLGDHVSVADWANVYSHSHDIHDIEDVTLARTTIEDGCRITYHATVLAGVTIHQDGMLGAMALATRDVERHFVNGGIPARPLTVKRRPGTRMQRRREEKRKDVP